MSSEEILQAQEELSKNIEKAQLGEDRQLASVVRERGEQVARLLAAVLRLPRLYDMSNDAFSRPTTMLLQEMTALRELLGSIHFIVVESQVYINDIRIRFDVASDTPKALEETLKPHRVGGFSFHSVPEYEQILKLVARVAEGVLPGENPRHALQQWLIQEGTPFIELHPIYRFVLKGETQRKAASADVKAVYERSSRAASDLYGTLAMGRNPNTVAIRKVITDMVDLGDGAQVAELVQTQRDRATPPPVRHAIGVSNLAILIGRGIGLTDAALSDLGVAAFMHDVGYTMDEGGFAPPFARHGTAGARQMLMQRGFHEARIRRVLVCLQHHRRYDDPHQPSLFARIVHIADDFDTLTRPREGGPLMSPTEALARMWGSRGKHYDPVCLQAFVNHVGVYPPGSVLELDDGSWVTVTSGVRSPETFAHPMAALVRTADGRLLAEAIPLDLATAGRAVRRIIRPRE